jgi:hypothetical protein
VWKAQECTVAIPSKRLFRAQFYDNRDLTELSATPGDFIKQPKSHGHELFERWNTSTAESVGENYRRTHDLFFKIAFPFAKSSSSVLRALAAFHRRRSR